MTLTEMAFTVPSTGIIRPSDGERCCAGRVAIEKIARRATCRMKVIPTTHFTLPHQYASILAATAVRFHWRLLCMCRFLIVVAIGAMSNLIAHPDTGTVNGMVTNEDGKTVAGATVYAYPIDRPIVGIIPHNITDASGHFEIKGLSWGLYAVSGAKADEGYPEMLSAFFTRNQVMQKVTLAPETSTATLTVQLGPKAGRLTGTVTDGLTSAPLSPCARFSWASEANNYLLGTGLVTSDFNTLIPSSTGVLWKVWLDGYKPWYYPGTSDESAATTLRLQAGQVISIAIRLEPDAAARMEGCGMPVGTVIKK